MNFITTISPLQGGKYRLYNKHVFPNKQCLHRCTLGVIKALYFKLTVSIKFRSIRFLSGFIMCVFFFFFEQHD